MQQATRHREDSHADSYTTRRDVTPTGKGISMKKRNSLRSLAAKDGAILVRRRGRLFVINKKHPRWTARQG